MTRPFIGLTTSYADASPPEEPAARQQLDLRYVDALTRVGATPLILPTTPEDATRAALLPKLDGLLIPGGPGIELGILGELPPELPPTPAPRLASDLAWLRAARMRKLPVLGICYGMQLINAELGGRIYADVEKQLPGALAHSPKRGATRHSIELVPGGFLQLALDTMAIEVNTRHLQAIAELGADLIAAAHAEDGVLEAFEHESEPLFGVQFHPEAMADAAGDAILRDFLSRC